MEFSTKLNKNIKKEGLKPLYIFYGEEIAGIESYINKITNNDFIKAESLESIKPYLTSNGLFTDSINWIVLYNSKNILNMDYKKLKGMLGNTKLILVYDSIDKRKKFFKDAKNDLYEFKQLKESDLVSYVSSQLDINSNKALYIVRASNNDMTILNKEIAKLKHVELNGTAIKQIVIQNPQDRIFEYIDSLLAKDKKKAFKLYNDMLELKESPIKMLSILYLSLRVRYIINSMPNRTDKEIADKTDLSYWQVKMNRQKKCNIGNKRIEELLEDVRKLEIDIKTGKKDTYIGYEKLMIDILRS
jgi:DNA polymerase-3 subunit delta